MIDDASGSTTTSRRRFLGVSGVALAAATALPLAGAQEKKDRSPDHHLPNEKQPGANNTALDVENPSSV